MNNNPIHMFPEPHATVFLKGTLSTVSQDYSDNDQTGSRAGVILRTVRLLQEHFRRVLGATCGPGPEAYKPEVSVYRSEVSVKPRSPGGGSCQGE